MTTTVKNGSLVALDVEWARGKCGFVDSDGICQLAYDPVAGEPWPEIGDDIDVDGDIYFVVDMTRDPGTAKRILLLAPAA